MIEQTKVVLHGGLGNQLFQIAFAVAMRRETRKRIVLTRSRRGPDAAVNIEAKFALPFEIVPLPWHSQLVLRLAKKIQIDPRIAYVENKFERDAPNSILRFHPALVSGYLQYPAMLEKYRNELSEMFRIRYPLNAYANEMAERMNQDQGTVAVHVRRGDYTQSQASGVFALLDVDYYERAEARIARRVTNPHYYVFSNEIRWAKENLHFAGSTTFVDSEASGEAGDFSLMRLAEHWILANSTFSWWPAWLSRSDSSEVIMPKKWFVDGRSNHFLFPNCTAL